MRHLEAGRKLGVNPAHRKALLRSLTLALIEQERIQTTPSRAKELRWYADHVVTLAKRGDVASRRQIVRLLGASETHGDQPNRVRTAIARVYKDLVPRFKTRAGGYTQIIRLAKRRFGDNAQLCVMQYLPPPETKKEKPGKSKGKGKKGEAKVKAKKKEEASAHAADANDHSHDHSHEGAKADKPHGKKKDE